MKIDKLEYKNLIDECFSLLSERKFDLSIRDLEWRHELGGLIENSKVYKEAENKTEFINRLSRDLNVSSPLLYQVLEFYRKFRDFNEFISGFNNQKKTLKWSDVRLLLVENPSRCRHDETYIENIQIKRKKCKKCYKTLEEEKQKNDEV